MRNLVNAPGIGKKGSCQVFRHTATTLMLENGADVRTPPQPRREDEEAREGCEAPLDALAALSAEEDGDDVDDEETRP